MACRRRNAPDGAGLAAHGVLVLHELRQRHRNAEKLVHRERPWHRRAATPVPQSGRPSDHRLVEPAGQAQAPSVLAGVGYLLGTRLQRDQVCLAAACAALRGAPVRHRSAGRRGRCHRRRCPGSCAFPGRARQLVGSAHRAGRRAWPAPALLVARSGCRKRKAGGWPGAGEEQQRTRVHRGSISKSVSSLGGSPSQMQ